MRACGSSRVLATVLLHLAGATLVLGHAGAAAAQPCQEVLEDEPDLWDAPDHYVDAAHYYFGVRGLGRFVIDQETAFDEGPLGHGGGFGVFTGVKLTPWVAFELDWDWTWHGQELDQAVGLRPVLDYMYLMTTSANIKVHFPTGTIIDPFLQVGGGYGWLWTAFEPRLDLEDDSIADGAVVKGGVGVNLWLTSLFSIGVKGLYTGVFLDELLFEDPRVQRRFPEHSAYVSLLVATLDLALHF